MAPDATKMSRSISAAIGGIGDAAATDAAFAKAHHIAKIDLVNNRLVPNAMASRAALAEFEPATGDYTLNTSAQFPHVARVLIGVLILGPSPAYYQWLNRAADAPPTLCGNAARFAPHSHSSREARRWRRAIRSNLAHPDAAAKSP
jgi:Molybdopterin cofactor-binding domain